MNSFNCQVYHKLIDGTLFKNPRNICWAMIKRYYDSDSGFSIDAKNVDKNEENIIYIADFKKPITEESISLLIEVVNEITPCELVTINNVEYIKFKLLKTYDQSLILLNFLRNLWFNPFEGYSEFGYKYITEFFKQLNTITEKDPLVRLTLANKNACAAVNSPFSPGHSNVHKHSDLVVRTTKDLLNFKGCSTQDFLKNRDNTEG